MRNTPSRENISKLGLACLGWSWLMMVMLCPSSSVTASATLESIYNPHDELIIESLQSYCSHYGQFSDTNYPEQRFDIILFSLPFPSEPAVRQTMWGRFRGWSWALRFPAWQSLGTHNATQSLLWPGQFHQRGCPENGEGRWSLETESCIYYWCSLD